MDRRPFRPYAVPSPADVRPVSPGWSGHYRDRMDDALERAERVRADLGAVQATASTPDGAVVATVDAAGVLTGLRFGERAEGLPPERLADLVLATVTDAASHAAHRVAALVADLGGDSPYSDRSSLGALPPTTRPRG